MPSVTATPAAFVIDWGAVTTKPARETAGALVLRFTGGSVTAGPSSSLSSGVTTPKLDRLTRFDALTRGAEVSPRFQTIWQETMEAIEEAFAALTTQVSDNTTIIARLTAAENLATAANDNAVQVQSQVNLGGSFTNPVGVGAASSAGVVTISAHERVYVDGLVRDVNSGSVSGFAPGDYATVYYVDAARAGGAVVYQGTTGAVSQSGATHIVWQGEIPAIGQPDAAGTGPTAPGYTPPNPYDYDPRLIAYELSLL